MLVLMRRNQKKTWRMGVLDAPLGAMWMSSGLKFLAVADTVSIQRALNGTVYLCPKLVLPGNT